jgi:tetratricopeptide (TPR) repeat protein
MLLVILKYAVALPIVAGAVVWLFFRAFRNAEDRGSLAVKWGVSLLVIGLWFWHVAPQAGRGGMFTWDSVILTMVCGLVVACAWAGSIGAMFAKPFTMLLDDNREMEPQPYYSVALARSKRGQHIEAVAEIRRQLERFPTDFAGQMLLAETLAEKLVDLPAAENIVRKCLAQPGHAPKNVAYALNTLADWKLRLASDAAGARLALERVVQLMPETEFSVQAEQRLAHLQEPGSMATPSLEVPTHAGNFGLLQSIQHMVPVEQNPEEILGELKAQLEIHPHDYEARERLAALYARALQLPTEAIEQLELLIAATHCAPKQTARWLNLLADVHIELRRDFESARAALERIEERFPGQSFAQLARNRIELLKLEFKGKEKSQTVRLGSYEQNIGLKLGLPRKP